ncbi:radical SAM/SPASM domain-containing protein [uncultured Anaerococcus sp.]|uniref:radical SAM/SPASM domain-containing protein n=1 Tax=uncultured Anaerococcus sp. TaxID=293428 RepID=UPI002623D8C0|nr:radical SAM protein [uncultured Anaerococcus sp.]
MKLINYEYDNIIDIASNERIPFVVTIELNTICNLKCEHCYIPSHTNEGMDIETIKTLLNNLRELGTFELVFTGGEIFLRKDIYDILKYSRDLGFSIKLFTNVTLIDEEMAEKLSKLPISLISTSIYSLTDEIHDSITHKKGSLQMALQGIENIRKYNIPLEVKMIVMNKNINSIKSLEQFCKEKDIKFVASPFVFPKSNGDISPINNRVNDKESLFTIVDSIDDISKFNPAVHDDNDYICPNMRYSIGIECNGNVNPCNALFYSIGNIYNESIKKIWDSENLKAFQNMKFGDLKDCKGCANKSFCIRCPGIAHSESGNYLKSYAFACSMAEVRHYKYKEREEEFLNENQ